MITRNEVAIKIIIMTETMILIVAVVLISVVEEEVELFSVVFEFEEVVVVLKLVFVVDRFVVVADGLEFVVRCGQYAGSGFQFMLVVRCTLFLALAIILIPEYTLQGKSAEGMVIVFPWSLSFLKGKYPYAFVPHFPPGHVLWSTVNSLICSTSFFILKDTWPRACILILYKTIL